MLMRSAGSPWCLSAEHWLASIDNRHVATDSSFGKATRITREAILKSGAESSQRHKRQQGGLYCGSPTEQAAVQHGCPTALVSEKNYGAGGFRPHVAKPPVNTRKSARVKGR
ncbi:protein of unknown function (plasmid) [Caballeronia sp. S22]